MKAKKVVALILSLILIFSVVPTFGMFASAEDAANSIVDDDDFIPEYRGKLFVKADNYGVNLSRAFSNLVSSVMYTYLGIFWTSLFPAVSVPIAVVGGSTSIVAFGKFIKALAGLQV